MTLHVVDRESCQPGKIRLTTNCVVMKEVSENNCSALRHSSVLLPYYLAPIDIPYLITHQALPRNYGYVIRRERPLSVDIYWPHLPIYTRLPHSRQEKYPKSLINFLPILSAGPKETAPKGHSGRIEGVYCGDYVFFKKAPA